MILSSKFGRDGQEENTHWGLIDAQSLTHIWAHGKQQSIPPCQLISALRFSRQQRPMILRQPLLKLTHPRSEHTQLRLNSPGPHPISPTRSTALESVQRARMPIPDSQRVVYQRSL